MKKIVIASLFMMLVCGVQAAQTLWSSGTLKDPVTGLNLGSNNANFSAIISFYTDAAGLNSVAVTGNTDDMTNISSALSGTTDNVFAATTTYYAKIIITSDDSKWVMQSGIAAFKTPVNPNNANINFTTGAGFVVVDNKLASGWVAVPEPTSMALLALGVAAVGLRRRFLK